MRVIGLYLATALFALAAGTAGAARAEGWRCSIEMKASQLNWVAPDILVQTDAEGQPTVIDGIVNALYGKPIEARIGAETAKRYTYVWDIMATDNTGVYAKTSYRLSVQKADGKARITATPQGFSNSFDGVGTCDRL